MQDIKIMVWHSAIEYGKIIYLFISIFTARQRHNRLLWDDKKVYWRLRADIIKGYTLQKKKNNNNNKKIKIKKLMQMNQWETG